MNQQQQRWDVDSDKELSAQLSPSGQGIKDEQDSQIEQVISPDKFENSKLMLLGQVEQLETFDQRDQVVDKQDFDATERPDQNENGNNSLTRDKRFSQTQMLKSQSQSKLRHDPYQQSIQKMQKQIQTLKKTQQVALEQSRLRMFAQTSFGGSVLQDKSALLQQNLTGPRNNENLIIDGVPNRTTERESIIEQNAKLVQQLRQGFESRINSDEELKSARKKTQDAKSKLPKGQLSRDHIQSNPDSFRSKFRVLSQKKQPKLSEQTGDKVDVKMKKKHHKVTVEEIVNDFNDDQIDAVIAPSKQSKNQWVDANLHQPQVASESNDNRIRRPFMEETRIGEDHSIDQSLMQLNSDVALLEPSQEIVVDNPLPVKTKPLKDVTKMQAPSAMALKMVKVQSERQFQTVTAKDFGLDSIKKSTTEVKLNKQEANNDSDDESDFSALYDGPASLDQDQQLFSSIRHSGITPKSTRHYTVSMIDKEFSQVSKQQRQLIMEQNIQKLSKQNQPYFNGKKLRIENGSSYFQIIVDPVHTNYQIALQLVQRTKIYPTTYESDSDSVQSTHDETQSLAAQQYLDIDLLVDENHQLNQINSQIVEYARTRHSTLPNLRETVDCDQKLTLISFWRPNNKLVKGQHECWNTIPVADMLTRTVNKQRNISQGLFTGDNKKVFYFSKHADQIKLNVLNRQSDSTKTTRAVHKNSGKTKIESSAIVDPLEIVTLECMIEANSLLETELIYQIQSHSVSPNCKFSYPDPTLVTLKGIDFLVLTILDEEQSPCVCFFQISQANQGAKTDPYSISGEPKYRIKGAELFISIDKQANFRFLTNKNNCTKQGKDSRSPDINRLLSPSIIKEVSYDDLNKHKQINLKKQATDVQTNNENLWSLDTDSTSLDFFRCQSHKFPFVQSVENREAQTLTLLFHSSDLMPSYAIYFSLRQNQDANELLEGQSVQTLSNELNGHYISQTDEIVRVKLTLKHRDASGVDLSQESSGKEHSGKKFQVVGQTYHQEWVQEKWTSLNQSKSKQNLPFVISQLDFDESSGLIVSGKARIFGRKNEFDLVSDQNVSNNTDVQTEDEKKVKSSYYHGEKPFRLIFKSSEMYETRYENKISIEGSFINEPFNTKLIGKFSEQDSQGIEVRQNSFLIQKYSQCRLSFEYSDKIVQFNADIKAGNVTNQSNAIELKSTHRLCQLFDHVHQVMAFGEKGTYIFHGDIQKLLQQKSEQNSNQNLDHVFKIAQLSSAPIAGSKHKSQNYNGVLRKDIGIPSEKALKDIWNRDHIANDNGIIQAVKIIQNPMQVSYSTIVSNKAEFDNTIKFVHDELKTTTAFDTQQNQVNAFQISGVAPMNQVIDYPLLAYNSFLPSSSELVVTNMAERQMTSQVVNLGSNWQFICFVNSVCLSQILNLKEQNCQIYFLAWHKGLNKARLMALDQDPWDKDKQMSVFRLPSCDISLPPISLDSLKAVYLLAREDQGRAQMVMLLQYTQQMWSVSLTQPDKNAPVFDLSQIKMRQRYAVRRINDYAHVYCLVKAQNKEQIVRIEMGEKDGSEMIKIVEIFESHNSKLLVIEPDPQNSRHLFVVDEGEQILKIDDDGEGKAQVVLQVDLSHYDLEDELQLLSQTPWKSLVICDLTMELEEFTFSMRQEFLWKAEKVFSGQMYSQSNVPGTLKSQQIWNLDDGSSMIVLKPLAGTDVIDLVGMFKAKFNKSLYLANDKKVLLQTSEDQRILVFDDEGYICHQELPPCFSSKQTITKESTQNSNYGKFFLLSDPKNHQTLLQADSLGFNEVINNFSVDQIKKKIQKSDHTTLCDLLNINPKDSNARIEAQRSFEKSFMIHNQYSLLSQKGELVLIASAVVSSADQNQTIFQRLSETAHENPNSSFVCQKAFGIFQYKQIKVVILLCSDKKQQGFLNDGGSRESQGKKAKYQSTSQRTSLQPRVSMLQSLVVQRAEKRSASISNEFIFGLVDKKLVWLNYDGQLIQSINLPSWDQNVTQNNQKVDWATYDCPSFSIEDLATGSVKEFYRTSNIYIDELPQNSTIRLKTNLVGSQDQESCLMQLTLGTYAIVYNLSKQQKLEVTMLDQISQFDNPVSFSHTGFSYNTPQLCYQSNLSSSLGIVRSTDRHRNSMLHRAFSEIDMRQVEQIAELVINKDSLSKSSLQNIEVQALTKMYGDETFFSLFAEQAPIYDMVHDQLREIRQKQKHLDQLLPTDVILLRCLYFVLDRPTPLTTIQSDSELLGLSIVKQCLLFQERKATVSLYKVSDQVNLSLNNYIENLDDLQIVIDRLPAQQYSRIFNRFEQNLHTIAANEAVMAKYGEKATLLTFIKSSAVIWEDTLELGLHREQTDDEVKRAVLIRHLPLSWISSQDGSQTDLFMFIRRNLDKLEGSLLLDAIFAVFWAEQQKLILKFAFLPFLMYFFVANFYLTQCLLGELGQSLGFWFYVCPLITDEEDVCDVQTWLEPKIRFIVLALLCQQLLIEFYQLRKDGLRNYLSQPSNKNDLLSSTLCLTNITMMSLGVEITKIRLLASFNIVLLWAQLFFWFRLFDSLAQYVELIFQTVRDIKYFMYVLGSLVLMFQSGFYMLQINRISPPFADDKTSLYPYDENQGSLYGSSILSQYFVLLGDFGEMNLQRSYADYGENTVWVQVENALSVLYFIMSTFCTQIVILNMLIAIMASTFDKHSRNMVQNGKRQKLVLQSEFVKLVNFYQRFMCCCFQNRSRKFKTSQSPGYMFVVTPNRRNEDDSDQEENDAKSKVENFVIKAMDSKFKDLDNFLNRKLLRSFQDFSSEQRVRLDTLEKSTFEVQSSLKKELQQKFAAVNEKIEENQKALQAYVKEEMKSQNKDNLEKIFKKSILVGR